MAGHLTVPTALAADDMTVVLKSATAPLSGTSGTGAGTWAAPGALLRCTATGVLYFNEGSLASPYWTPTNYGQFGLLAFATDFRAGLGKAVADTAASATIADGTGIRVHGQGIAETDSGLTVAFAEGGAVASLITTDEDAHLAALSQPGTSPIYQPDTHGPLVIDADVAMSSAITLRRFFIGFLGTLADALDPPATGATTTITLVQDDLAGLYFDAGLTAAARLFAPHNKSDEAASIATTATGVDTGSDFPAAGTYVRLRVEISAAGVMTCFVNKAQVSQIAASLDVDEEVAPSLLVGSTSAATKTMLVKRVAFWGNRG
jgi:hypothetical protein